MEQAIIDFLVGAVQNYPWFAVPISILGITRAVFKPIMAVVDAYVLSTPTPNDDAAIAKFKTGKIYWVIDYILSIKIPK